MRLFLGTEHGGINLHNILSWEDNPTTERLTVKVGIQHLMLGHVSESAPIEKIFEGRDRLKLLPALQQQTL